MSETFSARANAVFGVLDEPTKAGGWQLDPAQGFNPGAADALEQDSSEDGEEVPEAGSLPGADDSEEEQSYKQKASKCYRRAFEREEEEDEFDRVAAGSISQEQRPARSTEVLEDNIFDRMHSHSYQAAPAGPSTTAALEQQQPMDWDETPPPLEPPATQHIRGQQQLHEQQQENPQDQLRRPQTPSGQAWRPALTQSDDRPWDAAANGGHQQHNSQQQHQQERRVRFVDANAGAGSRQQQLQQQQQGRGRGSRIAGRSRGGRKGQSFVPDHVLNPQRYIVYALDEPLYVGQGGRDVQEMQTLDRGHTANYRSERSNRAGRRAAGKESIAAADDQANRGRWQDSDDDAPMLLKVAAAAAGADADLDSITANAESIRQLPPVGSIRFQPSSKRARSQTAAGTPSASQVAHQVAEARAQDTGLPESAPASLGSAVLGAFVEEQARDDEPAEVTRIASTSAAYGKSSRQRNYRRRSSTDEGPCK